MGLGVRHLDLHDVHTVASTVCVFVLKNKPLSDTCQSESNSLEGGNSCPGWGHPHGGLCSRSRDSGWSGSRTGVEAVKVLRGTLGVRGIPIPAKLPCQKSHEDTPEGVEGEEPRSEPQGGQKCGVGGVLVRTGFSEAQKEVQEPD